MSSKARREKRRGSIDSTEDQPTRSQAQSVSDNDEGDNDSYEEYGTPIRSRQRFTADETRTLEEMFRRTNRPSSEAKQKLAIRFDTTTQRIQIWFQNRRAKENKNASMVDSGSTTVDDSSSAVDGVGFTADGIDNSMNQEPEDGQGQRKKKRRMQELDGGQSRIQLRPGISLYQESQAEPLPPLPTYPFTIPRRFEPNMVLHDGRWYFAVPPSTINPAEMENPSLVPFNPGGEFNIVEAGEFIGGDYADDATSLELLAEASTTRQEKPTEDTQNILTHEGDENLPTKGEFYALL